MTSAIERRAMSSFRNPILKKHVIQGEFFESPIQPDKLFLFDPQAVTTSHDPYLIVTKLPDNIIYASRKTPRSIINKKRSPGQRYREENPNEPQSATEAGHDGNGKKPPHIPPTTNVDPNESEEDSQRRRLYAQLADQLIPGRRNLTEIKETVEKAMEFRRFLESCDEEDDPEEITPPTPSQYELQRQRWHQLKESAYMRLHSAASKKRLSRQDAASINQLGQTMDKTEAFYTSIPGGLVTLHESTGNQERESLETNDYMAETSALSLGALLRFANLLNRFDTLLDRHGVGEEARHYTTIRRIMEADFLNVSIDDVPLRVAFERPPKIQTDLRNALDIFMVAYEITYKEAVARFDLDEDYTATMESIYGDMIDRIPNQFVPEFRVWIYASVDRIISDITFLPDANPDLLAKITRTHTKGDQGSVVRPIVDSANQIIQNVATVKKALFAYFSNPDTLATMEPKLLDTIRKYINKNGAISDRLFQLLLFDQPENLQCAFRTIATVVHDRPELQPAYEDILNALVHYSSFIRIPILEDVEVVLTEEPIDMSLMTDENALWTQLFQSANRIKQISRTTDFTYRQGAAETGEISGKHVVEPAQVSIHFDRQKPFVFKIGLTYANQETEETLDLELSLDAKQKTIDWNVLEDMPANIRSILLSLVQRALRSTEQAAAQSRQQTLSYTVLPQASESIRKGVKTHFRDPVYDLRKAENQFRAQAHIAQRGATSKYRSEIQYEIALTDDIRERYVDRLPTQIQEAVLRKIADFNQGRRGQFKGMTSRYTGEMLWRLRVGAYRILVGEEGSTHNHMRFTIRDIRLKKETYRHAAGL